jgi:AcrR family transcriptional regulator
VTEPSTEQPSRMVRRKARTRAALISAAQRLIAEGRTNVPILEITQAADVGMGSFYNHFETKEQLYAAAVEEVMDAFGDLLDRVTADIEDAAEVFATSFRLAGRLHRREPELSKVLLNNALPLLSAPNGLAPRARRDIEAATLTGRFQVDDVDLAVTLAAGALLALGQLLHDQPDRDADDAADRMTESLLRVFGLTPRQAHQLCTRPLPDLVGGQDSGSAA